MKAPGLSWTLALALAAPACAAIPGHEAAETSSIGTCPSDDFEVFLQHFAEVRGGDVRRRYTADPLRYEVPPHVAGVSDDVPGLHGRKVSGDERLRLFSYRFDPVVRGYVAAGNHVAGGPVTPVPIDIGLLPRNGRRVAFGSEYEVELYFFAWSEGCWVLTDVIDPRD